MNLVNAQEIINTFNLLNESKVNYILLRNIDDKIPYNQPLLSDIDILVPKKNFNVISNLLIKASFYENKNHCINDIYLYGADKHRQFIKNNVLLDFQFQLMVRSLDAGQWIPLDQKIQKSAWENKRFEKISEEFGFWTLSYNDEFLTLVVRSIFDKREFQEGYIKRIEELKEKIYLNDVIKKMELVFFKFTPYLLEMIDKKDYKNIIKNYIQFKGY